jgi:hypothetical protein
MLQNGIDDRQAFASITTCSIQIPKSRSWQVLGALDVPTLVEGFSQKHPRPELLVIYKVLSPVRIKGDERASISLLTVDP